MKIQSWGWYYLGTVLDDYSRYVICWRLLSDNGPCYVSKGLADWMDENEMKHIRGKPYHPQTQGKIERYHRTMKNVVKLQNYWMPGELQQELGTFVAWYNTQRYHESLENLTPEDVYVGRAREIQTQRQLLKMQTLRARRCYNRGLEVREKAVIRPGASRESVY